jgi:hypothetical protein
VHRAGALALLRLPESDARSRTGSTCVPPRGWIGRGFIDLPGELAPGETALLELVFRGAAEDPIRRFRVLAGPGER